MAESGAFTTMRDFLLRLRHLITVSHYSQREEEQLRRKQHGGLHDKTRIEDAPS